MTDTFKRDQDEFFRMLDDLQKKEIKKEQAKPRKLAEGLKDSVEFVASAQKKGVDIVANRALILQVLREFIPEVWSVPEAKPMVDLLFPNS